MLLCAAANIDPCNILIHMCTPPAYYVRTPHMLYILNMVHTKEAESNWINSIAFWLLDERPQVLNGIEGERLRVALCKVKRVATLRRARGKEDMNSRRSDPIIKKFILLSFSLVRFIVFTYVYILYYRWRLNDWDSHTHKQKQTRTGTASIARASIISKLLAIWF